jgi:WXXGXW repeat (2 copies)
MTTSTRLFKNSIATAALAAALAIAPIAAEAQQYSSPDQYGQSGAPANQYGNEYAMQQDSGAPQAGAPQGIQQAPPAIPDYTQPPAPGDGYIWTPGYWAWNGYGYAWVQGAWVAAPYVGALWTPGYWGYGYGGYFWNTGYWGPYVGYYGGINYGFGYFGIGFYGGYWGGGRFWYNTAYCRLGFRGGYAYNRAYAGYTGHPGGASFTRASYSANRSGNFRGSNINGQSFANRGVNSNVRTSSLNNRAVGSSQARNFAQTSQARSYGQQSYAGRSYAAPSAPRSFSGGGYQGGGSSYHGGGGYSGGGGGHR